MKGRDRCTLEVAPEDATRLGLRHGGHARVESRIASIIVPVEVSERMTPGVVSLAHGWGHDLPGVQLAVATRRPGVNANLVVDDKEVDAPSGTSVLSGVSVRVSPA